MSINVGQLTATTLRERNDLEDNVSNHNGLFRYLKGKGKVQKVSGGRTILCPIHYVENGTTKYFDGGQESFSIPVEEVIDAAEYDWKFHGGFIYYTMAEKVKNAGDSAAIDLMEAKIENLRATTANDISVGLYADGTGSAGKEPGGLQFLVDDDPTSAGTVGGIDQAASSGAFWRNYTSGSQTLTSANIQSFMKLAWFGTKRGADQVDLITSSSDLFTMYWDSLSDLQRFTSPSGADVTYEDGIKFQRASVIWDDACTSKRMYFLNTDHLKVVARTGHWLNVGDSRTVTNAAYEVVPLFSAFNLVCSRRASNGVIIDD